ncbi:MAG: hypothetical protein R3346_02990 [Candidatus Spechtbacterales bacterium]|nr:hypothetical protein [Candidatus Spechtbacterales bacterium]
MSDSEEEKIYIASFCTTRIRNHLNREVIHGLRVIKATSKGEARSKIHRTLNTQYPALEGWSRSHLVIEHVQDVLRTL